MVIGFRPTQSDPCVYTHGSGVTLIILTLYVDDTLTTGKDPTLVEQKKELKERFEMTNMRLVSRILGMEVKPCAPLTAFRLFCFSFPVFSTPPRGTEKLYKYSSVFCILLGPTTYRKYHLPQTPDPQKKQSLSLRHNKMLSYIPSARSSLLLLQHMASEAREGCQPVRQTGSLPGPLADGSVGHVSRGEQKAQTASQQSPGTASACEGLLEQGSCDRVPRNNGVEAGRGFSRISRGNDSRHVVLRFTNKYNVLIYLLSCFV